MVARWLSALLLMVSSAQAAALPTYRIIPDKSRIVFTAIQNHAPVQGSFTRFGGVIVFDSKQLARSSAKVTIDLASVTSATAQLAETLRSADWFDNARHPQAVFKASGFNAMGKGRYEAQGTLTIKGIKQPVTLLFTVKELTLARATASGEALLKRTAFQVGWKDTTTVSDPVKVVFEIQAAASP